MRFLFNVLLTLKNLIITIPIPAPIYSMDAINTDVICSSRILEIGALMP
jgi:hypothetical protein